MLGNVRRFFNTTNAKWRRYRKFTELVGLEPHHKVIHIGCGHGYSFERYNSENDVVGVDLMPSTDINRKRFSYVQADGDNLAMFEYKEFDLSISIGTLEHIHPYSKLEKMRRVARGYVVIIPHYWTLIEPHYQMPLWQFYPHFLKKFLYSHFNVGNYYKDPSGDYEHLNYYRKSTWQELFPDAQIYDYNHVGLGIIKNFIIYKPI
jgi:ubiquinone/menaquinone biosynthesis C-methylase UbiE